MYRTSEVLLSLYILHQLWVHVADDIKQWLYWRVCRDAPPSLGVASHTVHKDLHTAVESMKKLVRVFICLSILIHLEKLETLFFQTWTKAFGSVFQSTLNSLETAFDAFAKRADADQTALVRAAWSWSTLFANENMVRYDPTLVDLTSYFFVLCTRAPPAISHCSHLLPKM